MFGPDKNEDHNLSARYLIKRRTSRGVEEGTLLFIQILLSSKHANKNREACTVNSHQWTENYRRF